MEEGGSLIQGIFTSAALLSVCPKSVEFVENAETSFLMKRVSLPRKNHNKSIASESDRRILYPVKQLW